jgi:ketosteroid isomerase-like protein
VELGDLMFCEGVEMLFDKANQRLIRNPFMQALEFRDGKVAKMRDYYDSAAFAVPQQKAGEG